MTSKIEWCEETYNPIIGCSKISLGCRNCYAERMANRMRNNPKTEHIYGPVTNIEGKWNGVTHLVESALDKPLKRKKPTTYFVSSMGDLFHHDVKLHMLHEVFTRMVKCPQHIFQILTKRPERMREFINGYFKSTYGDLPSNIWLGVSAENQKMAEERIPILLETGTGKIIRYVSVEPMLGPVDISEYLHESTCTIRVRVIQGCICGRNLPGDIPQEDCIDWVICGAESGPGRRECNDDWVKSLINQCKKAVTPFFLKQMYGDGDLEAKSVKVKMPFFSGRVWDQMPQR